LLAITFEENGQLMPKHMGNVRHPSSQMGHIRWLVERLDANPNVIVEHVHHQLYEAFQFPWYLSIMF
jgi:hypothetical protein